MAALVRLDTHVVVWLYTADVDKLSPTAIDLIESNDISISPMVELELTYLHEIGRLGTTGADIVNDLAARIGLQTSTVPLQQLVHVAAGLSWTRDPFDRMITADASISATRLVTKDAVIRANYPLALW